MAAQLDPDPNVNLGIGSVAILTERERWKGKNRQRRWLNRHWPKEMKGKNVCSDWKDLGSGGRRCDCLAEFCVLSS